MILGRFFRGNADEDLGCEHLQGRDFDTVFVSDEFTMEGEEDPGSETKADIMVSIRKTNLAIN